MFDILIKLAEEPKKLTHLGLLLIRITTDLVLGGFLHEKVFKRSLADDLTDLSLLIDNSFNGYIVYAILTILLSHFILELFISIIAFLLHLIIDKMATKSMPKSDDDFSDFIQFQFKFFGIVKKNKNKRLIAGEGFDKFLLFFKALKFHKTDTNSITLIDELNHTLIGLLLVQLFIINKNVGYHSVVGIVCFGILICIIVYFINYVFLKLMDKFEDKLDSITNLLFSERLLESELKKLGANFDEETIAQDTRYGWPFILKNVKYYYIYLNPEILDFSPNNLFVHIENSIKNLSTEKLLIITESLDLNLKDKAIYIDRYEQVIHISIDGLNENEIGKLINNKLTDSIYTVKTSRAD